MNARRAIEVAAGLIFRNSQLLIAQRRKSDHLGGYWEFPGGKRECGEDFPTCLRRELREELGVDVEVGDVLEDIIHDYPEISVRLVFYRCRLLLGEPQPLGCARVVWINRDELRSFAFPPADARLLDRLSSSPDLWEECVPRQLHT